MSITIETTSTSGSYTRPNFSITDDIYVNTTSGTTTNATDNRLDSVYADMLRAQLDNNITGGSVFGGFNTTGIDQTPTTIGIDQGYTDDTVTSTWNPIITDVEDLQKDVNYLDKDIHQLRAELNNSKNEVNELRDELKKLKDQIKLILEI